MSPTSTRRTDSPRRREEEEEDEDDELEICWKTVDTKNRELKTHIGMLFSILKTPPSNRPNDDSKQSFSSDEIREETANSTCVCSIVNTRRTKWRICQIYTFRTFWWRHILVEPWKVRISSNIYGAIHKNIKIYILLILKLVKMFLECFCIKIYILFSL